MSIIRYKYRFDHGWMDDEKNMDLGRGINIVTLHMEDMKLKLLSCL